MADISRTRRGELLAGGSEALARTGTLRHVVLLHLSEQCNQPDLAIRAAGRRSRHRRPEAQVHAARASLPLRAFWSRPRGRGPAAGLAAGKHQTHASPKTAGSEERRARSPVSSAGIRTRKVGRGDLPIVAHYFASDVHLRFDRPDHDRRFSAWLSRLDPRGCSADRR